MRLSNPIVYDSYRELFEIDKSQLLLILIESLIKSKDVAIVVKTLKLRYSSKSTEHVCIHLQKVCSFQILYSD